MIKSKKFIVFAFLVFILPAVAFCVFAENITLTTYYPSPYGIYHELRVKRTAIGDNYYNSSLYCWPGGPCAYPNIAANADLVVEGNVGIGTITPQYNQDGRTIQFDVAENIITKDVYLDNPKTGSPTWVSDVLGTVSIDVYRCPQGTGGWNPGGAWGSYGCQGQISASSTCENIEYPHHQTRDCAYLGKLLLR